MKQFFMVNFLKVHLNAPRGSGVTLTPRNICLLFGRGPEISKCSWPGLTCQRISRLISLFCLWSWAQLNRKKRQHGEGPSHGHMAGEEGVNWRCQQKQLCSHLERSRQQVRTQCELIKIETFRDH